MRYLRKAVCLLLALSLFLGLAPGRGQALETTDVPETAETAPTGTAPPETEHIPQSQPPETTAETAVPEETGLPEEPEAMPEETPPPPETEPEDDLYSQSTSMCFGAEGYTEFFHDVPLYWQTDYPNVRYGGGTVASSGCTITALAMAASYLTGREYLPDALARRFNTLAGGNVEKMEAAADLLGITYRKTTQWQDIMDGLQQGGIAMIQLNSTSCLTDAQHVVVLTGITREERILVNDPNSDNYRRPELKVCFQEGFPPALLSQGFSGGWVLEEFERAPIDLEKLNDVPLYLQTDYQDTPYSDGTVATSGCTMTCVAMVAASLSGREVRPDDLARRFNHYEASNIQRMEAASTVLDLIYGKTFRWTDVVNALMQGRLVIVLLGKPSPFTGNQHTVVLTGITEEGRILVNDPYGPNHSKEALKEGFEKGFPPEMLKTGFSGAWIYEGYTQPERKQSRYGELELTAEEKYLMASIIWLEARGECFEGQQAIAEIILNRFTAGTFGASIRQTILAEGQFRTTKFLDDAKPGELQYKAIEKALYGPNVLPEDVYFFARKAVNDKVWGSIGGHVFCYGY